MCNGVHLLPAAALVRTGPVDHADWNYRPLLGIVSRARFGLAAKLLPARLDAVLEIGYGSGVFAPTLARRARTVAGVDIHPHAAEVGRALRAHGVEADLRTVHGTALPFADASFDAVVAISALEFIDDLDAALAEIARVLRPGGAFVTVTPAESRLLDAALRLATGEDPKADFGDRRARIVPALRRAFFIDRSLAWPPVASALLPVYRAYCCTVPFPPTVQVYDWTERQAGT